MSITDTVVRFAAGGLSCWLLLEWWRQDARVVVLSKFLSVGLLAVVFAGMVIWMSYSEGIRTQFARDSSVVLKEWSVRNQSTNDLVIKTQDEKFPSREQIAELLARADIEMAPSGLITGTSALLLVWLWIVLGFVATVPPLRSHRVAEPDASEEDKRTEEDRGDGT